MQAEPPTPTVPPHDGPAYDYWLLVQPAPEPVRQAFLSAFTATSGPNAIPYEDFFDGLPSPFRVFAGELVSAENEHACLAYRRIRQAYARHCPAYSRRERAEVYAFLGFFIFYLARIP